MGKIADRIDQCMYQQRMSGAELAEKVKVSRQSINRWLNGHRISDENIAALAHALGVSEEWLRYGSKAANKESTEQAIAVIIEEVELYLSTKKIKLSPQKKAKLVSLIFSLTSEGELSHEQIASLVDLAGG